MAGQGEKVTVTIRGGGPWGFRLFGGEHLPLTVAKLRRKSKGYEAGLHEGDVLLTINGYSCKDMTHGTAMTLVDTSGQQLTMTVLRGTQDKNAVDAAFQTLGPSKVVPAHLMGQSRSETYNGNNINASGGAATDMMDYNEAAGASGAVQTYHMNGPGGPGPDTHRTQQTFYDGDTTRQVTTETSQQQFGSTTVTKVRREEVSTSGGGGWPSPGTTQRHVHYQQDSTSYPSGGGGTGVPTFSVTKFESSTQPQQKPGVWAPSGAGGGGGVGLTVSAPEGVHVQQNADQSVTMTVGLGSPRQQQQQQQPSLASPRQQQQQYGLASPRQRDVSPSQPSPQQHYDAGKHVPQFNVAKVAAGPRPDVWAPGGAGGDAPVLRPFTVEVESKWSPTPRKKPIPPETAPKPQFPPQTYEPPKPAPAPEDELDAIPDGPPPPLHAHPHWAHLDPSARDSPITRIPENPPQIEPVHFHEMIRGESFSDEDDYLDSPDTLARKSFFSKKIYADSSFYDDPEARYPTIEEQIKMARRVAMSLMSPANKKARGHKMFMKRLRKSSRWVAGAGGQPEIEYYIEEYEDDDDDEKYYQPNPWKSTGHTWQPPSHHGPAAYHPSSAPGFTYPTPAPKPTLSPYKPAAPAATSPAREVSPLPVPHVPLPEPYHLHKEEPKPEAPSFQLAKNPAYRPSIPKPFRLATDEQVTEAPHLLFGNEELDAGHHHHDHVDEGGPGRDSPVFKPSAEFNKEFNEDMDIPLAPPPPPPPIPNLSALTTGMPTKPYSDFGSEDKENKKKMSPDEFERVRLYGKKSMHNVVSPQVCFSLADDLRNMKGKGGRLFAKRRAKAEKWVVEDKTGQQSMPGPDNEMRAKILGQTAMQSPQSPPVRSAMDTVDYNKPSGGGPGRLKELISASTKSSVSPWEAAMEGNVDKAFDHLRYNTLPLRGKKGGGSHSLVNLTGTHYTSSNPAAADAAPSYSTATTYHKGRPQVSPGSRPSPRQQLPSQQQSKMPDYTRKIQPWGAVPTTQTPSGPPSGGAVIDWSDFGEPAVTSQPEIPASSGPSQPDYNRRMKPWRGSGNFDHVDVSRMGEASAPSPGGFRSVSFKSPSSNFGAFGGSSSSSQVQISSAPAPPPEQPLAPAPVPVPVGGGGEGYSDL